MMAKKGELVPHAVERAQQRYGVQLTKDLHAYLVNQIQRGEALAVGKVSGSRSMFLVSYGHTVMLVAYNKERQNITTFLPPEMSLESIGGNGGMITGDPPQTLCILWDAWRDQFTKERWSK